MLKVPSIEVRDVVMPGTPRLLTIPKSVALELNALWGVEGFGCLDVAYVAPGANVAVLAETHLADQDLALDVDEVRVFVSDAARVEFRSIAVPTAYAGSWSGSFVEVASAPATCEISADLLSDIRVQTARALLVTEGGEEARRQAAEVMLALDHAKDARLVHIAAHVAYGDDARKALLHKGALTQDDGDSLLQVLANLGADAPLGAQVWVEDVIDERLTPARETLTALRKAMQMRAFDGSPEHKQTFKRICKDLEKLTGQLEALLEGDDD